MAEYKKVYLQVNDVELEDATGTIRECEAVLRFTRSDEWPGGAQSRFPLDVADDYEVGGVVWTDASVTHAALRIALEATLKAAVLADPRWAGGSFV